MPTTFGFPSLPTSARAVIAATIAAAAVLLLAAFALAPGPPHVGRTLLLAAAVWAGEALRITLPMRRGGSVLFTLGEAGLTAGLLLARPEEVMLAAAAGVALGQAPFPAAPVKRVFNVAQYTVSAGAAALVYMAVHGPTGPLRPSALGALAAALVVYGLLNALQVAAVLSATTDVLLGATMRKILSSNAVLTTGSGCIGLIAVALLEGPVWVLPALAAPLLLLYSASRQRVASQLDAERAVAFAGVQHRLADASDANGVANGLVDGAWRVLGVDAAVSLDGRWFGRQADDVPDSATKVAMGPARLHAWGGHQSGPASPEPWLARLGELGAAALERTLSRAALEQERTMLRAVVDGSGDGIYVLESRGAVREWNPAMGRLAGVPASSAAGMPVVEVLGPGPWASPGYHEVVRVAEGPHNRVVWRLAVTSVSHGSRNLRIGVVHDVTAERRAARTKEDMLAIVSHELRSPLTPIKAGALTLLRRWDRLREEQRTSLLEQIAQQADHLTRLVDDLLLVGQTLADRDLRPSLQLAPIDLTELCRMIVTDSAAHHPGHTVRLELTPHVRDGLLATSDPSRLRQVLGNLLDNACKYSAPGTTVVVSLTADGDSAVLTVTDQGRGIPAGDRDRVFERFERIDHPDFMTTSGAGLGLHIVQRLVHALGGTIELDSQVGVGTTVTVRLPLRSPTGVSDALEGVDRAAG